MFDEYNDQDATDCANGDYNVYEEREVFNDHEGDEESEDILSCDHGEHLYGFVEHCGAQVCMNCEDHEGLVRCYCGWSFDGGDGRQELIDMGENLEEDW